MNYVAKLLKKARLHKILTKFAEKIDEPMKKSISYLVISAVILAACTSKQEGGEELWNDILRLKVETKTDSLLIALNLYQMNYPKGAHQYTAENMKSRILAEQNDWDALMKKYPTRMEIVQFLDEHPEGFYQQPALEQIDHIDYAEAVNTNTEESYEEYLRNYPNGLHRHDAQTRYNKFKGVVIKLTDLEKRDVRDLLIRHFIAFQSGDSAVVETLAPEVDYWNHHSITPDDVCQLMDSVRRLDYRLIYTMDSVLIHKIPRHRPFIYSAVFGMTVHYVPRDPDKSERSVHWNVSAIITPDLKIRELSR